MVEIESTLGKASFGEQGSTDASRQVYSVSDEMEQDVQHVQQHVYRQPSIPTAPQQFSGGGGGIRQLTEEERQELEAKRRQTRTLMERVSPRAKERIEYLCNLGRLTDEFEFEGTMFKIRSLKGKELKEILLAVANVNPLVLGIDLRNETLARSVYEIDGQTMDLVLGTNDMDARVALWDDMDDHAADYINVKYQKLASDAQEKYGINSKEDAKEVANDIKKS